MTAAAVELRRPIGPWWEAAPPAPGWHAARAKPCRTDPDAWFPADGMPDEDLTEACGGCPFRVECLEDAIEAGPEFGVWAGVSVIEIHDLRAAKGLGPPLKRPDCGHPHRELYIGSSDGRIKCRECARIRTRNRRVAA